MEIAEWLRSVGLEQYAQTFRDNAIDIALLPALTDPHLKELGLPLGHRLKLCRRSPRIARPRRRPRPGQRNQRPNRQFPRSAGS